MSEAVVEQQTLTGRPVTALYRGIMVEIERRRLSLGWPMWRLDDEAGTQDGYFAKALWADTKSGRQARWETLQLVVDALFPAGFDIELRPKPGLVMTEQAQRQKIRFAAALTNTKTQRELMRELSQMATSEARSRGRMKIPYWKRKKIARKAARARAEKRQNGAQLERADAVVEKGQK